MSVSFTMTFNSQLKGQDGIWFDLNSSGKPSRIKVEYFTEETVAVWNKSIKDITRQAVGIGGMHSWGGMQDQWDYSLGYSPTSGSARYITYIGIGSNLPETQPVLSGGLNAEHAIHMMEFGRKGGTLIKPKREGHKLWFRSPRDSNNLYFAKQIIQGAIQAYKPIYHMENFLLNNLPKVIEGVGNKSINALNAMSTLSSYVKIYNLNNKPKKSEPYNPNRRTYGNGKYSK